MVRSRGKVYIVDDEPVVLRSLARLLGFAGFDVETYTSAASFLTARKAEPRPCCLVLDIKMPDMDGFELQEQLLHGSWCIPTVFISGYGDIPTSVRAMRKGAVTFLSKPLNDQELIEAVLEAVAKDAAKKQDVVALTSIQKRLCRLTDREYEILTYVISGLLNKEIAATLKISEKTVKTHRGRVMEKMEVRSLAELVRMAQKAGISPAVNEKQAARPNRSIIR